jgi:hypothetical protein
MLCASGSMVTYASSKTMRQAHQRASILHPCAQPNWKVWVEFAVELYAFCMISRKNPKSSKSRLGVLRDGVPIAGWTPNYRLDSELPRDGKWQSGRSLSSNLKGAVRLQVARVAMPRPRAHQRPPSKHPPGLGPTGHQSRGRPARAGCSQPANASGGLPRWCK